VSDELTWADFLRTLEQAFNVIYVQIRPASGNGTPIPTLRRVFPDGLSEEMALYLDAKDAFRVVPASRKRSVLSRLKIPKDEYNRL
jgi:hypothetical protein